MRLHILLTYLTLFYVVASIYASEASSDYTLEVRTAQKYAFGNPNPRTFNKVQVSLEGVVRKTAFVTLSNGNDGFENGSLEVFNLDFSEKIISERCLVFRILGDNSWVLEKAVLINNKKSFSTTFYNSEGVIMSADSSEGSETLRLCRKGRYSYILETETSNREGSASRRIFLSLKLYGHNHKTATTGIIKNGGTDDFQKGEKNSFRLDSLPKIDVRCIHLEANTGGTDKWTFQRIRLTRESFGDSAEMIYTFNNNGYNYTLSADRSEGLSGIKFCL